MKENLFYGLIQTPEAESKSEAAPKLHDGDQVKNLDPQEAELKRPVTCRITHHQIQ